MLQARATASPLGVKLFPLVVQHITAPDVPPTVFTSGFSPIHTLPLLEARVLLQAFDHTLPSPPPSLVPWLERLRQRIHLETLAETEIDTLFRDPQALLLRFRARVPTLLPGEKAISPVTNPVALLITAVSSERKAVLDLLRDDHHLNLSREESGGRYFHRFAWKGREHTWDVLLAQPTEKGGPAAQAVLQHFLQKHQPQPKLVLMVGMCGGLPENGAKEGMVILARQVFNYEPARLREGGSAWNPGAYRSSARILDLANSLAADGEFETIDVKTTKDYASGDKLIDDLGSELRQKIIALSGDILGFEMEAPDMLHTAWELARTESFDIAIAKGVSDFGDGKLRDDKEKRQRLATQNAAKVALSLLTNF